MVTYVTLDYLFYGKVFFAPSKLKKKTGRYINKRNSNG